MAPPPGMERLWETPPAVKLQQRPDSQALDYSLCSGRTVIVSSGDSTSTTGRTGHPTTAMDDEDDDTPMICMICEDKATGLHYGIITCEG